MSSLLADTVAERADAPAVVDAEGSCTWAELDDRVRRLVHALRARGLVEGDRVAAMLGNQRELVEVSLACLHGGWLLVPVNWHSVADERAYLLADSGARAVVVDHRWIEPTAAALDSLEGDDQAAVPVRLVVGDAVLSRAVDYEAVLVDGGDEPLDDPVRGGVMFYTSGTTGRPKGVRGSLSSIGGDPVMWTLMAHSMRPVLELPEEGGVQLICGPMYHSAQWVFATFALLCGSSVVVQHRFDADELLTLVELHGVTNLHLVPTQMLRLLQLSEARRRSTQLDSLRSVLHGAAPCPPSVKREMIDWLGPMVTEYYGGTEGGFISTISAEEWLDRPGSVGRPVPIIEVVVIGEEGERVGSGETGDLYFRSLLGNDFEYHNAAEKTEAAHLEPGLATLGDVGRLDADGYLYLSDRRIDMIVSGGVNVYPAEVEAVLAEHDAVADVAVFGIPDDDMGESARVALELAEGHEWSPALEAALVGHCRTHLSGYKCPRSFEVHERLPRSEAGKLLKRALRDPWWHDRDRAI